MPAVSLRKPTERTNTRSTGLPKLTWRQAPRLPGSARSVAPKFPKHYHSLMPVLTDVQRAYSPLRAPRGHQLSCKGWQQEAALRMLMNNLDEEVAEKPEDLIVYGGRGKAARNWNCYHAIIASLRSLENDETLLVQSGKPVGIFR